MLKYTWANMKKYDTDPLTFSKYFFQKCFKIISVLIEMWDTVKHLKYINLFTQIITLFIKNARQHTDSGTNLIKMIPLLIKKKKIV